MANSAIRLRAMLDFESESGEKRVAGDEWLFEGPGTACQKFLKEEIRSIYLIGSQQNLMTFSRTTVQFR